MHPVFAAQLNHILSLLNSGHSGHVFHLMLVSITLPSPEFAGNIVLTYKMSQLDILQSFLRLILTMPNTLLPLGRLRMCK